MFSLWNPDRCSFPANWKSYLQARRLQSLKIESRHTKSSFRQNLNTLNKCINMLMGNGPQIPVVYNGINQYLCFLTAMNQILDFQAILISTKNSHNLITIPKKNEQLYFMSRENSSTGVSVQIFSVLFATSKQICWYTWILANDSGSASKADWYNFWYISLQLRNSFTLFSNWKKNGCNNSFEQLIDTYLISHLTEPLQLIARLKGIRSSRNSSRRGGAKWMACVD